MMLPYLFRLLCLCFASFFSLNALLSSLIRLTSKTAIRFAETKPPDSAARFLFALRLLPFALSTLFVIVLCVPSYLWLEPSNTGEEVGWVCSSLGFLGALICSLSIWRIARALLASWRHNRLCASLGFETHLPGDSAPVVVIENEAPLLAVSGLLHPRLLISRGVVRALSAEELEVAFRHEHAHHASRDNAKRLLILLAPDTIPFLPMLRTLECNWSKFTEWAADDQATEGNSLRALSLAAALVRVARMDAGPRVPALATSLLSGDRDLEARIARLLVPNPLRFAATDPPDSDLRFRGAALLVAAVLAAMVLAPSTLSAVHSLLERFIH
jgi:beta-lactamase regulating signal transducer with metallopeptidase domain